MERVVHADLGIGRIRAERDEVSNSSCIDVELGVDREAPRQLGRVLGRGSAGH